MAVFTKVFLLRSFGVSFVLIIIHAHAHNPEIFILDPTTHDFY